MPTFMSEIFKAMCERQCCVGRHSVVGLMLRFFRHCITSYFCFSVYNAVIMTQATGLETLTHLGSSDVYAGFNFGLSQEA